MAAAATQPPAPAASGLFTFLKHGVLLPLHNRGLFLPLLALTAAFTAAIHVTNNSLAVQPLAGAGAGADAIGHADPGSAAYLALVKRLSGDPRRHLLEVGRFILAAVVSVVVGSAVRIATVFAAVAAFSAARDGAERPTVAAVVAGARGNLWGPVLSAAFGHVLEVAGAGAIFVLSWPMVYLQEHSLLLFLDALLVLLASLFLIYLSVVFTVAVVVSAAEPGRRGAGAVSRAWRLMERKKAQAAVYLAATAALSAAVSPVFYPRALRLWPRGAWGGVAAGAAYVVLLGAVEVFSVVAVTAYYFECRQSKQEIMARHRRAKLLNGDEANNEHLIKIKVNLKF